jgi:DNA end-binding protein Ku
MAAITWKGRIAFGMVSIPVRLYKAARRERIRFHHVYQPQAEPELEEEADAPVDPPRRGPRLVAPADPTPVEPEAAPVARVHTMPMAMPSAGEPDAAPEPVRKQDILKAFEIEKDRFVTFQPREIAALRPRTSSELAITEFVRLAEIDPVFFDVSYYVEPDAGAEKPYAVLFTALVDSGYAALGSLAMHGREHVALIRPGRRGLILHTIFYAKEVRREGEYAADSSLVGPKERGLATMLVDALAAPFEPEKLKNVQEERLRALIESRAESAVPAAGTDAPPKTPPAIDLMEALRKSIAAARKPAQRETRTPPAAAQTARRPRKK